MFIYTAVQDLKSFSLQAKVIRPLSGLWWDFFDMEDSRSSKPFLTFRLGKKDDAVTGVCFLYYHSSSQLPGGDIKLKTTRVR